MSETMVERVAAAMRKECETNGAGHIVAASVMWDGCAIAAIEDIREHMLSREVEAQAAATAWDHPTNRWLALIDAALSPNKETDR